MPHPRFVVPTRHLHKPSWRVVVDIDRRPVYLGPWGSSKAGEACGIRQSPDSASAGTLPMGGVSLEIVPPVQLTLETGRPVRKC